MSNFFGKVQNIAKEAANSKLLHNAKLKLEETAKTIGNEVTNSTLNVTDKLLNTATDAATGVISKAEKSAIGAISTLPKIGGKRRKKSSKTKKLKKSRKYRKSKKSKKSRKTRRRRR